MPNILPPSILFVDVLCAARVTAVIEILIQVNTEGFSHFVKGPMRDALKLEPSSETFVQT